MPRVLSESGWTSPAEERANAITHGIAAALAVGALVMFIAASVGGGDARRIVTASVFGASLVLLYVASTCYHLCSEGRWKRAWRVFDHSAIYLLIAGSYTPFLVVFLRGMWGWTLLGILWALATYGVLSKVRSFKQSALRSLSLYLGMGWIGVLAAKPFLEAMPGGCIAWIVAGGLSYTLGVTFYLWERLPFHHAVWHLFVAGGSACHVIAVMWYVLPKPA